jgi:arylsulfatase A-like enzyme
VFNKNKQGAPQRHSSAKDDGVDGIKFYPLDGTDDQMPDYRSVDFAIQQLNAKHDKPFFLAIGMWKPHMPFSVPKKWFDMFPLDSIELPPTTKDDLKDIPPAGIRMSKPKGDHAAILNSGRWKEAVQAYLATIAFCDSQVGRLLESLEKSAYADNTIVCLWSDHGWSLGEKEHWRKFALWEEPTRSVFIWKVPGVTPAGKQCAVPVDLMSIYPTLCKLTGIPVPGHVEGVDITPLLREPATTDWNAPALTTHGKENHGLRSGPWRYIRYDDGGEELYNHTDDPYEWRNLANDPKYVETKQQLRKMLPASNAKDIPRNKGGGSEAAAK